MFGEKSYGRAYFEMLLGGQQIKIDKLRTALAENQKLLEEIEWNGHPEEIKCPSCGNNGPYDLHKPDCKLRKCKTAVTRCGDE